MFYTDSSGFKRLDHKKFAEQKYYNELLRKDAAGTISCYELVEMGLMRQRFDEEELARRMAEREKQMRADLCYEKETEARAHPQAISIHDA